MLKEWAQEHVFGADALARPAHAVSPDDGVENGAGLERQRFASRVLAEEPQDELRREGDVLTLRGEKQELPRDVKQNFLRLERRYGAFVRSLRLPSPVSADGAEARSRNGVLEIRMVKQESARPRKVNITLEK